VRRARGGGTDGWNGVCAPRPHVVSVQALVRMPESPALNQEEEWNRGNTGEFA